MLQLADLGQIASPLHSTWIFGHIASHRDHLQFGKRTFEPVDHLAAYKAWLLMKCQTIWPKHDDLDDQVSIMADVQHLRKFASVPLDFFLGLPWWSAPRSVMCLAAVLHQIVHGSMPPESQVPEVLSLVPCCKEDDTVLHDEGEKLVCHVTDGHAPFEVSVGKHTTAADLAAAEGQLQDWPQVCIRNCDADASPIQPDDVIQGHSLMVCQVDSDQGYGLPSNDWCLAHGPTLGTCPSSSNGQWNIDQTHCHVASYVAARVDSC